MARTLKEDLKILCRGIASTMNREINYLNADRIWIDSPDILNEEYYETYQDLISIQHEFAAYFWIKEYNLGLNI